MATEVTLPALGESVTEGTVTRWLKQVGDQVAVDEPLLEVSTDKVDTEIPSPVAGTLVEIKANEDDTVEVGAVLALVGEEGEGDSGSEDSGSEDSGSDDSGSDDSGSDDSGSDDSGSDEGQQEDSAGGGEDVEQERAEQEAEEKDSDGEAPSEQEPAAESSSDDSDDSGESSGGGGGGGTSVTLPALGESVTEGTVTRWLKQVGDDVAVDEPLLEVSTDKVDTEIPSPVAGKLLEIKVEEDETVEVGAELAVVGSGEASSGDDSSDDSSGDEEKEPEPEQEAEPEPEAEDESRVRGGAGARARARGQGRA